MQNDSIEKQEWKKEGVTVTKSSVWSFCLLAVPAMIALSATNFADDGSKEGIKVHGHWKIEIFDPDGTRVSVTEFENALDPGGGQLIAESLTGMRVLGAFFISLDSSSATAKPCIDPDDPEEVVAPCLIGEPGLIYPGLNLHATTLQVSTGAYITLQGSVTAGSESPVEIVSTNLTSCDWNDAATRELCRTGAPEIIEFHTFTEAVLADPPSVVPNQYIQVTVQISFS